MTEQWIWLLGASQMQIPMMQEIKRRDYKLLATDGLNHDCSGKDLADYFTVIDVYSEQDNLDFAKYKLDFKPVAVLTAGTDAGVEVAAVAAYFGLPAVKPEIAYRVRNKTLLRRWLDMPYPRFRVGRNGDFDGWSIYPCVVKADNASGSKGFSVVNEAAELPGAIGKAMKANRGSNQILVEELLTGKDVLPQFAEYDTSEASIEFFIDDGRVIYANGALRLFDRTRPGIEAGHFNPFLPDDDIMKLAQTAADRLKVNWGVLKLDIKQDSRYGWVILEGATRLSGGFDSSYTAPLATGKDIYGAFLDLALGQPLDYSKLENTKGRVACCLAPVYQPGKIKGWGGEQALDMEMSIYPDGTEMIFYRTNTEIKPLESNADRPVFLIADGATHQEAYEAARGLAERVKPIYQ